MAKILVVDDEQDMRMAIRNVLLPEGHRIEEVSDGETALAQLRRSTVDLVLLDVCLPGIDGFHTLRKIREMRKDLPVIMITGYGSDETADELIAFGANDYIQKPFDNQHLSQVVKNTLADPKKSTGSTNPKGPVHTKASAAMEKAAPAPEKKTAEKAPAPAAKKPAAVPPKAAPTKAAPAAPAAPPAAPPAARRRVVSSLPPPISEPTTNIIPHIVAGVLVVIALGMWVFMHAPKVDLRDYTLLSKNPSGLSFSDGRLWYSDWAAQSISLLDSSFHTERAVKLPGVHPTGLCVANGFIYVSDSWRKVIERRRLDDTLSLDVSVTSPGRSPSGLFFDGTYLWSTDSEEGKVYRHDIKTLDAKLFYPTPGRSPIGVYVDGSTMWTADADTRMVYRHKIGPNLPIEETLSLGSLAEGQDPLSAMTFHDGHFWLTRDGSSSLLKRHPSAFHSQ